VGNTNRLIGTNAAVLECEESIHPALHAIEGGMPNCRKRLGRRTKMSSLNDFETKAWDTEFFPVFNDVCENIIVAIAPVESEPTSRFIIGFGLDGKSYC